MQQASETPAGSLARALVPLPSARERRAPERRVAESLRVTLLEVVVRLAGAAAEQRRASHERQELLIAELNHRVRNILALIRALVSRSQESAETLESFVGVLNGRIQSLARAHDQLTDDRWGPVPLRGILEGEFRAFLGEEQQERTRLSGPPVLVEPQALTVLEALFGQVFLVTLVARLVTLWVRQDDQR